MVPGTPRAGRSAAASVPPLPSSVPHEGLPVELSGFCCNCLDGAALCTNATKCFRCKQDRHVPGNASNAQVRRGELRVLVPIHRPQLHHGAQGRRARRGDRGQHQQVHTHAAAGGAREDASAARVWRGSSSPCSGSFAGGLRGGRSSRTSSRQVRRHTALRVDREPR